MMASRPGWEISKRSAPPETLRWRARFLAEKKAPIARVKWWRASDLRRRQLVVVPSGPSLMMTVEPLDRLVKRQDAPWGA